MQRSGTINTVDALPGHNVCVGGGGGMPYVVLILEIQIGLMYMYLYSVYGSYTYRCICMSIDTKLYMSPLPFSSHQNAGCHCAREFSVELQSSKYIQMKQFLLWKRSDC